VASEHDDKSAGATRMNWIGFGESSLDRCCKRRAIDTLKRRLEVDSLTFGPGRVWIRGEWCRENAGLRAELVLCCVHDERAAKPLAENCRSVAESKHGRGGALAVALNTPLKERDELETGPAHVLGYYSSRVAMRNKGTGTEKLGEET
jgi:hypothetical protein